MYTNKNTNLITLTNIMASLPNYVVLKSEQAIKNLIAKVESEDLKFARRVAARLDDYAYDDDEDDDYEDDEDEDDEDDLKVYTYGKVKKRRKPPKKRAKRKGK
jgi:hypothetical protein